MVEKFTPQNENEGVARDEGGQLQAVPDFPVLFKHMVLAIFLSGDVNRARPTRSENRIPVKSSPNKDNFDDTKFNAAMDIALAQLKKYKMIAEKSSRDGIILTGYGRETNAKHLREPTSRSKTMRFDKYFTALLIEGKKRVPKPSKR